MKHLLIGLVTSALLAASTLSVSAQSPSPDQHAQMSEGGAVSTDVRTPAADLRTALDLLLGEHIILAVKSTGAALDGDSERFQAYAALLNTNGTDIGAMIGAVYGDDARDAFNAIWSAHNGFFVDYTTGVATKDRQMQRRAVRDLTETYVPEFSALIAGATGLPVEAVTELVTDHVLQTKAIVDAQAKRAWPEAYSATREAHGHMRMIGDALASAIAGQRPDLFPGQAASPAVDFRVALNQLLQEHLYLATLATDAALGGRNKEFQAAGTALNTNGTDIGAAVGSLYGQEAQDAFNAIWSAHNGFFVDYTTGVATDDAALRDKAVTDLTTIYVPQFAAFLAGATGIDEASLAELITHHVVTTKVVVDAQGAGDPVAAAAADLDAGRHMQMLGDPLAEAIVAALPEKFQ